MNGILCSQPSHTRRGVRSLSPRHGYQLKRAPPRKRVMSSLIVSESVVPTTVAAPQPSQLHTGCVKALVTRVNFFVDVSVKLILTLTSTLFDIAHDVDVNFFFVYV